ncbi:replication protein RepA [Azospirillum sp. 11R-A]|uniref:Pirin n=1 Tax=Azospirillum palustre TaxID=2044885 RepID=A0A2B8BLM8_9PROT|nr:MULTISPECIES: replication protein RepA [Azospirillum]PGH58755.1 pirin [Azospirillum palustre]PWC46901.1 pirin [Azospirillum sp. TSA6c]PWC79593.1 pirin [Azospirillum sp. TSH64]
MGSIHRLIETHGRDGALALVSDEERPLIDIAAAVQAAENGKLGITYAGFCQTALPHRQLPDDQHWERPGHKVKLVIQPGVIEDRNGVTRRIGVPYGSRARMILLYLQTRAIQTGNPEVELGGSMHDWLKRMDIPICGKAYRDVEDQAARLSACHLTFFTDADGGRRQSKESIVADAIQLRRPDDRQGTLFTETVRLSDSFFKALREHPVPVAEEALKAISGKSMALDVYIWLAYRLHSLDKPTPITWAALHGQFGAGYALVRQFKTKFIPNLKYAMAAYPDARVEESGEGLILHPSRPPINERVVARIA